MESSTGFPSKSLEPLDSLKMKFCRTLFVVLLSVGAIDAEAQTFDPASRCTPRTFKTPYAEGSDLFEYWTTKGIGLAWWCPSKTQPGFFGVTTLGVLWGPAFEVVKQAVPKVIGAEDPQAAAIVEINTAFSTQGATPGSVEACELSVLRRATCVAFLQSTQSGFPGPFIKADAEAKCAPALICVPQITYAVDAATAADGTRPAFALVAGIRAPLSTSRAISGQPCKPEIAQSPSGVNNKIFAAYGPNFSPNMVALCKKL